LAADAAHFQESDKAHLVGLPLLAGPQRLLRAKADGQEWLSYENRELARHRARPNLYSETNS
jgi:hypothetical protein